VTLLPRRTWLWLGLLTGLALALRLLVLWRLPLPDLSGDAKNYIHMVEQLLSRGVYGYLSTEPNAYVTPGYPLFLTAVWWLVGGEAGPAVVRALQVLLGALTVWPFFLLARQMAGERVAIITGVLLALYPSWVRAPAYLLTEVLFTFLFGWYLWVQVQSLAQWRRWQWPLGTGVLLGLAVLVRPAVAPLVLLPWLYQFWLERDRRIVRAALIAAGGFCLVLLPWWVRNVVVLDKVVFLATQTGNPLLAGMDPYGMFGGQLWAGTASDTSVQMQRAGEVFLWLLREHPWLTLKWFTVGKFGRMFLAPWLGWELPTLNLLHYPVAALGWLGALAALVRRHPLQFLSLTLGALTAIHLAFIPESRYAYPMIGILAILASVAAVRVFSGGDLDALARSGTGIQRSRLGGARGD
jgi:4-amino-4-deoxy-L-arabinose transferase-like glycosyltransferase